MSSVDPVFFEKYIIKKLFSDMDVRDKLVPYLDAKYFEMDMDNSKIVQSYIDFHEEFGSYPKPNELMIALDEGTQESNRIVSKYEIILDIGDDEYNKKFMLSEVEEFFKKKLLAAEVSNLLAIVKGKNSAEATAIRDRMTEILSFTFDTNIGLITDEASEDRIFDAMHAADRVISTGLTEIDKMIDGFHEKSLILFLGATNVGKTLTQCAFASNCLLQNKKVLYVTFEESEDKLIRRILANMFDIPIKELSKLSRADFKRIYGDKVIKRIKNHLVIKEYPEGSINANRLRGLLLDLKNKKGFVPDIVFVDYIGCMLPNRMTKEMNENTILKSVTAEVRALSMEFGMPFVSALQANRGGFDKLDMDLTDTAGSIGSTTKADAIFAIVTNDDLKAAGLYKFILLKSRFGLNAGTCFVKVDYPTMRLSDADLDDTTSIVESTGKGSQKQNMTAEQRNASASKFFKQDNKLSEAKKIVQPVSKLLTL